MQALCSVRFRDEGERFQMQMRFNDAMNKNQNNRNHEQERAKHVTASKRTRLHKEH